MRQDSPALNGWSLYGVHMLLGYLMEVAARDGRPGHLGFLARNPAERENATRLGFKQCPRHKAISGVGTYMCFEP